MSIGKSILCARFSCCSALQTNHIKTPKKILKPDPLFTLMVSQWKHPNSSHYTCWLSSSTVSPCNHSKCVTKAFIKVKQRLADISVINLITLWVFWWSQQRKAGNMRKDKGQGPTIKLETHCRMRLNPCGMCPNSELEDLFWKMQFCTCKSFRPTPSLYISKQTDFLLFFFLRALKW